MKTKNAKSTEKKRQQTSRSAPIFISPYMWALIFPFLTFCILFSIVLSKKVKNAYRIYQLRREDALLDTFVKTNPVKDIKQSYAKLPKNFQPNKIDWKQMSCLNISRNTFSAIAGSKASEPRLVSALSQIEEWEYSDEEVVHSEKGEVLEVLHQGEKSKRRVYYDSICTDAENYFVFFSTSEIRTNTQGFRFIPQVFAGGGMAEPSHLAVVNAQGELKMIENIQQKVPLGNDGGTPYFGCGHTIGVTNEFVYFSCGGGDGGVSSGGLFSLDLNTLSIQKVLYCTFVHDTEKEAVISQCTDQAHAQYYYNEKKVR